MSQALQPAIAILAIYAAVGCGVTDDTAGIPWDPVANKMGGTTIVKKADNTPESEGNALFFLTHPTDELRCGLILDFIVLATTYTFTHGGASFERALKNVEMNKIALTRLDCQELMAALGANRNVTLTFAGREFAYHASNFSAVLAGV